MYTSLKLYEVNHIKTSLQRCGAQGLADELGRAKETIKRKIGKIRTNQRIENISLYAREKKSGERRKLKREKHKIKRKVRDGM